jgi:hypothetical protein
MMDKISAVRKYYKGTEATISRQAIDQEFNYSGNYDALARFEGTHPRVMQERINRLNWKVDVDLNRVRMKPKYRLLHFIEKTTGIRLFEYRNYSLLKK